MQKASDAKQTGKEAEIRERIQLAVTSAKTNNLGELNKESYVNNYNEEHKNDEDFVSLRRWKYNQGDYPTFE